MVESLRKHALMLHVRGDPNGRHNLPGAPMLDLATGATFILGLAFCVRRVRRTEFAVLVAWLVLGMLPAVLSLDFEAPQAYRGIAVTPVLAIIAALAPGWLLSRAWESRGRLARAAAAAPVGAMLVFTVGANFYTYFYRQLADPSAWVSYSTPETLAARAIRALPPDT